MRTSRVWRVIASASAVVGLILGAGSAAAQEITSTTTTTSPESGTTPTPSPACTIAGPTDVTGGALQWWATLTVAGFSPGEPVEVSVVYLIGSFKGPSQTADGDGVLTYVWHNQSPQRQQAVEFRGTQSGAQCRTDRALWGEVWRQVMLLASTEPVPPTEPQAAVAAEVTAAPSFTG